MSLDSRLRGFQTEEVLINIAESLTAVKGKARRKIVLRRIGMTAIAAAIVATAIAVPVAISDRATNPITPVPPPGPTVSFHPATPTREAKSIAYVDQRDLWVYDVNADRTTRLTSNGEQRIEHDSAFYGDRYILYGSTDPTAIEAISLEGGAPITIVQEEGSIMDFDVSPDGSTLIYIHVDFDGDAIHRLKRVAVDGGRPVVLRELGAPPGRGAGSEDEVSVSWSPNGETILVTDTHVEPNEAIMLLDSDGKDVIPAWRGTHARWSPDGKIIYYRGYADHGDSRWRILNVADKRRRTLGFREGSNNLAISPDGTHVAYDTSWFGDVTRNTITSDEAPVVHVYDLRSGTETILKAGAVFPVWISSRALVATDARLPTQQSLNSWEPTGTATKLGLDRTRERVSITSTAWGDAAILFDD